MRSFSVQIIAALATGFTAFSLAPAAVAQRASPTPIPPQIEALLDQAEEFSSEWLVTPRPTANDYPQSAIDRGISGSATVACITPADGLIRFCKVVEETPLGSGFGEAAIAIVARGKLKPSDNPDTINVFKVRVPFGIS